MYEDFDDDDEQPTRWKATAIVVVLAIGGWLGYHKLTAIEEAGAGLRLDPPATSTLPPSESTEFAPAPTRPTTTEPPRATAPSTTAPAMALTRPSTTAVATTSTTPTTIAPASTSTSTSSAPPTSAAPAAPGSLLPNGVAVGALVTFDGAAVTMSGALPTAQARDRLVMFVTAANVTGKPIVNHVAVDADAPGGDSVRFVGLDPRAFPEGTSDIYPPHAAELDRIAELLNAFPDVAVVVIGRADQRGPTERNMDIAEGRAEALVAHLVSRGVDPDRLSSVAFGELDPTNPDDNVVAMSLNRRAEFVLYGLAN